MRILGVTPYFLPEGGGLERYAHATLSRLAALGHEVQVITFTRNGHGHTLMDGLDIRRRRPRIRLGNAPVDPAFPELVREAVDALDADVVLAHSPVPFAAEAAYRAARRSRVPFVLTYHAGRLRGSSPPLDALAAVARVTLERRMVQGSDALVAVTPFVRDHALAVRRDDVSVIPPGVDPVRFHPEPGLAGIRARRAQDSKEILFVGPLDSRYRWKGLDVLLKAFSRVRQHHPDATLRLVGDGDRMPELQALARRDPHVIVHGRASDDELPMLYRDAAMLCLPSTTEAESFGMVLAEANACGRPVVASCIGGIPDHVRHNHNGLLVRPGDPEDLAAKITTLLDDPALARRLGRDGRRHVLRDHDWDRITEATQQVLESVA